MAIRVRPLNQKEINSGDWNVIRIQENLIVRPSPSRSSSIPSNASSNKKIARCSRSTIGRRSSAMPSIASMPIRPQNRSTPKQSSHSSRPSSPGKMQLSSPTDQQGQARPSPCWAINRPMDSSTPPSTQRVSHCRHLPANLGRPRDGVHRRHQLRRNLQRNDPGPAGAHQWVFRVAGRLRTRYYFKDTGITIAGVTECKAESTEQVMGLLLAGNKRRTTEATNANLTSSRSHAVFQINISKRSRIKSINV